MFVSSEDDSWDDAREGPAPEAEFGLEMVDESSAGGWLPPAYEISDCVCEIPLMLRLRPLPALTFAVMFPPGSGPVAMAGSVIAYVICCACCIWCC